MGNQYEEHQKWKKMMGSHYQNDNYETPEEIEAKEAFYERQDARKEHRKPRAKKSFWNPFGR